MPFSVCSEVGHYCWSAETESEGYCCSNGLCDPYGDCSFGSGSTGSNNDVAAISTTTLLFVLCGLLFFALLYRRWRLRRDFLSQLQYLSYLEAADEQERERRMAASAPSMDDALEMSDVRPADNADGEVEEKNGRAAAARTAPTGGARGGFRAFSGRAFKLGEYEDEGEPVAVLSSGVRSDSVDESLSQHSIDLSLDADEEEDDDEKTS